MWEQPWWLELACTPAVGGSGCPGGAEQRARRGRGRQDVVEARGGGGGLAGGHGCTGTGTGTGTRTARRHVEEEAGRGFGCPGGAESRGRARAPALSVWREAARRGEDAAKAAGVSSPPRAPVFSARCYRNGRRRRL